MLAGFSLFAVVFSAAGTFSRAAIIPPDVNWEADLDTDGNSQWESSVNAGSTDPWNFGSPQTPTDVSGDTAGTDFANIQTAYSFPGAVATREDWDNGIPGGAGTPTEEDATFELVFRLNDDSGRHILFETGGSGRGTILFVDGTTLTFESQQGSGNNAVVSLTGLAVGDFHQVVATIDMESDAIDEIELFHNGQAFAGNTAGPADGTQNDWDGGDNAGLGSNNGTNADGGSFTNFDGDIAIMRYYRGTDFNQSQAQQNFGALVPEPSTIALAVMGLLGLCGELLRRRWRG